MGGDWKSIPKEYKRHWSTWKIEGTPLETTQKRLHAIGLHDPWIRNEVWMYKLPKDKTSFVKNVLTRGMFSGFAVFLGLLAVKNIFFAKKGGHDSHH